MHRMRVLKAFSSKGKDFKPGDIIFVSGQVVSEYVVRGLACQDSEYKETQDVSPPAWPLAMPPGDYLRRFPNGPRVRLARELVGDTA